MLRRILVASSLVGVVLAACGRPSGTVACDPLGAACSQPQERCFPVDTAVSSVCVTPGSVATGAPCTTVLSNPPDCTAGNICVNVGDSTSTTRKCVQFCNLDAGNPSCGSGTCTRVHGVDFGTCL